MDKIILWSELTPSERIQAITTPFDRLKPKPKERLTMKNTPLSENWYKNVVSMWTETKAQSL